MNTKQDRREKRRKKANEQAGIIIKEAVAAVKANSTRLENCTDEEWALAVKVRERRDAGMAWWQIAVDLDLPGAGTSASTGKKGAGQARKAYAKGYGAHPPSFVRGQGRSTTRRETNDSVRAIAQTTRRSRREQVLAGKGAIDPTIESADLAAMLKGRHISWMITGELCPEGFEMDAWVHPTFPIYIEGEGAERTIEFREMHKKAPVEFRLLPAHIRTVRLSAIFNVRGER